MEPLNRLYERICAGGYSAAFELLVLDGRARSLFSSEAVRRRFADGDGDGGITFPRLYTWAAEAGCDGEPGLADTTALWFLVRNSVHRPGGVTALIGAHRSAVAAHGAGGAAHLDEAVPAVVELLVEQGRTDEASALLAYLETAGDRALLGLGVENAGALGRDTAERYVSAEAAALANDVDAIYADERLRLRLLVLARVCATHIPADGPPELERLRGVFRANVRSFNALYWGDEATGALVEDCLRLDLLGMRLHTEACRERWFFERMVQRVRAADRPGFSHTLLLAAALRSDRVARWLSREPAADRTGAKGVRVRMALFKARIPRKSLYAELLTRACAGEHGAGCEEVRAVRGMVEGQVPVLWRAATLWAVIVPLWIATEAVDAPLWWEVGLGVPVGTLFAIQALKWRAERSWARSVLLPWRKDRTEKATVWFLVSSMLLKRPWSSYSPLYSKDHLRRHLRPLWAAIAFRDRVQEDPLLASELSLRLGRHSIHSADDVSVLLARHLPPGTSLSP